MPTMDSYSTSPDCILKYFLLVQINRKLKAKKNMKTTFLLILLFAFFYSNAQNNFIQKQGKITVFQNGKSYNFEIHPNNQFEYQDDACIVFFSPCGNCCSLRSVIVLNPEPHLKVYEFVAAADYPKHLLAKPDVQNGAERVIIVNFITGKIIFARTFFEYKTHDFAPCYSVKFYNEYVEIGVIDVMITRDKDYLLQPYKPNQTYTFKLPTLN